MFDASGWPNTPKTPHSSWNLSSWSTSSFTPSPRPFRQLQPYRGAVPLAIGEHAASSGPSSLPPRSADGRGRRGGVRLASRHGRREGSAHRRGADEAARAIRGAHAGNALVVGLAPGGSWGSEPPRNAQAARRPDGHLGMAGARPGTSAQRAADQVGAVGGRRGGGAPQV